MFRSVLLSVFIAAAIARAGGAESAPSPRASSVDAVMKCRSIADNVQRLACFDTAVGAMTKAEETGDLVTIDREQRRVVRRQAFGLTLPSLAILDRGEKPGAEDMTWKIASARQDGFGKWSIRLDDGAVWRQIDDSQLGRDPKPGETVTIRHAALGSFMMKFGRVDSLRVHREN